MQVLRSEFPGLAGRYADITGSVNARQRREVVQKFNRGNLQVSRRGAACPPSGGLLGASRAPPGWAGGWTQLSAGAGG